MPATTVPSNTPMVPKPTAVPKSTFITPKGTELPFLMMERKSLDKKTGQWSVKVTTYLQVAYRLVWFREDHPNWGIETEFITMADEAKRAICIARVKDDAGRIIATATKQETQADFPDFIEKAETGAVGRALALCGYGTQFAPELDEGERLADSPVAPAKQAETEAPTLSDDGLNGVLADIDKATKRTLIVLRSRLQSSVKLTDEQKETLNARIEARQAELDAKTE